MSDGQHTEGDHHAAGGDPAGPLAGLQLMHVGSTVDDLHGAIDRHRAMGIGPWAPSEPIDFTSYDGTRDAVVAQRLQLAFGRMPGGVAIELVHPLTLDGPQGRLLTQRPGLNHIAYWSEDLPGTGRDLLACGARLYAASSGAAGDWDREGRPGGIQGLIDRVPTATFRLPDGLLVEILDPAMWESGGFESFCGSVIRTVVDPPRRRRPAAG